MLFRKPKKNDTASISDSSYALDGHAAAYAASTIAGDVLVVQATADLAEITGPLRNLAPQRSVTLSGKPLEVCEVDVHTSLGGRIAGYAASGLRASALVSEIPGIRDVLAATAGKHLPCVIHLTGRATHRQGGSIHGGHDDYYEAASSGAFLLFAANAQEVADFCFIAHRIAERSLTPGVCAQDLYRTSHAVQQVRLPDDDFARNFIGVASDTIDAPTPSQKVLFGDKRRRLPRFVDPDHPAGMGGSYDQESYYKSAVAQRVFFGDHVEAIADDAMREFGERSGRHYERISGYRIDDADTVVVAQGAVIEELRVAADYLREKERIKVGVINVRMFRPFPGAELSTLLAGKKAVTVLERTDSPLEGDLPLTREVRVAIDCAIENGSAGGERPPHPAHALMTIRERPQVFAGIYGVGGEFPSLGELTAVVHNMTRDGARRRRFYVGLDLERDLRRLPHLQTLQQELHREYPVLDSVSLPAAAAVGPARGAVVQLRFLSAEGGLFAGNLFAQILSEEPGRSVRTFPRGGLEPGLESARLTIVHGDGALDGANMPTTANAVIVTSSGLLEELATGTSIRSGGEVIAGSGFSPDDLWRQMPVRTARWIRSQEMRLCTVDARSIAAESASRPSFVDQLAVWALFGAYLKMATDISSKEFDGVVERVRARIGELFAQDSPIVDEVVATFREGAKTVREIDWKETPEATAVAAETEPPWTVQQASSGEGQALGGAFDPTRFWHSVGYLYDTGQSRETLADPYLASGIIPARSSAFRDMTPFRLKVPQWLPENCTGCGLCWAQCPDSALPPATQSVDGLMQAAMKTCEAAGASLIQLRRLADHIGKQAYRLVRDDGLHTYTTMGPLLGDAFDQLLQKMEIPDENRIAVADEFEKVREQVEHFPVARTEIFFDVPHGETKGTGELLSIAVNPLACKGCGLCVAACPEGAFDWENQTPVRIERFQENWRFQMTLPRPSSTELAAKVTADARSEVNRLLDRDAYHTMVGGDGAFPGTSAKTAAHLVTATVESIMRPRFAAHVAELDRTIGKLEEKIQGKVAGTVEISDFEDFGKRLGRLEPGGLTPEELASLASEKSGAGRLDAGQLRRLSDLLGQLKEQRRLYADGAEGSGRSRMVMSFDSGAVARWSGTYPYNPHASPWLCHLPGDATAVSRSLFEGLAGRIIGEATLLRRAALAADDAPAPRVYGADFEKFGWDDLTSDERALIPPVLVLLHGDTVEWDDVERALTGRWPIKLVVLTSSAAAPSRDGGIAPNPALLAAARTDAFVLQASVGNPGHLIRGVAEGIQQPGPSLFHLYAPDPLADGVAPELVARQARLAYESRAFPLFHKGGDSISLAGNPSTDAEWTTRTLVFRDPSGSESSVEAALTPADWAFGEARFREHFTLLSKGHLNDGMKPLAEYIEMTDEQRSGLQPFIHVGSDDNRHMIAIVSTDIVQATAQAGDFWKGMQGMMTRPNDLETPAHAQPAGAQSKSAEVQVAASADAYQNLTEKLLWLSGYGRDPEFFKQSLRDFIMARQKSTAEETHPEN